MRKTTFCICENKSVFVCSTRIVQYLFFLNPKFPATSHLLCLYSSVSVEPVGKPHCWFSYDTAHFIFHSHCFSIGTVTTTMQATDHGIGLGGFMASMYIVTLGKLAHAINRDCKK